MMQLHSFLISLTSKSVSQSVSHFISIRIFGRRMSKLRHSKCFIVKLMIVTLTISVINETSAPNAVNGAPSLFFNAFFKCRPCETNKELNAFVQA